MGKIGIEVIPAEGAGASVKTWRTEQGMELVSVAREAEPLETAG